MFIKAGQFLVALVLGAGGTYVQAQSNVDPAHAIAHSQLIGRITFAPSEADGARINQFYCAGFLYGENLGWIKLGAGEPANGLNYQNNSAADFGVNVMPSGALRGYAYGANIGWLNFSDEGEPRVDWATGRLSGRIYAANAGWIELESGEMSIQLDSIAPAADRDADGLPDAWEIEQTGGLMALGRNGDADGDSQSDYEEYLAATDPMDGEDFLGLWMVVGEEEAVFEWPSRYGVVYQLEERAALDAQTAWSAASLAVTGSGGAMQARLGAEVTGARFFRLSAFPPLSSAQ